MTLREMLNSIEKQATELDLIDSEIVFCPNGKNERKIVMFNGKNLVTIVIKTSNRDDHRKVSMQKIESVQVTKKFGRYYIIHLSNKKILKRGI